MNVMNIKKMKNGNIVLQLDDSGYFYSSDFSGTLLNFFGTLSSCLYNEDLFLESDHNGGLWLMDISNQICYNISGCDTKGIYFAQKLLNKRYIELIPYGNLEDVKEYFTFSDFY